MEIKTQECIILGIATSSEETGDRLVAVLEDYRVRVEILRAVMMTALPDTPGANAGKATISVPVPTPVYRSLAIVPGLPNDGKLKNETWINTSVVNLAEVSPMMYSMSDEQRERSPYTVLHAVTRMAQALANGASVLISENRTTGVRKVLALVNVEDTRFVSSFTMNDGNGNLHELWAIEVLKNPAYTAAVERAINHGFKGTLPPDEWKFMSAELTSLTYDGSRVWGLKAEYSAAYLDMVNQINVPVARPKVNKEFGEG